MLRPFAFGGAALVLGAVVAISETAAQSAPIFTVSVVQSSPEAALVRTTRTFLRPTRIAIPVEVPGWTCELEATRQDHGVYSRGVRCTIEGSPASVSTRVVCCVGETCPEDTRTGRADFTIESGDATAMLVLECS